MKVSKRSLQTGLKQLNSFGLENETKVIIENFEGKIDSICIDLLNAVLSFRLFLGSLGIWESYPSGRSCRVVGSIARGGSGSDRRAGSAYDIRSRKPST